MGNRWGIYTMCARSGASEYRVSVLETGMYVYWCSSTGDYVLLANRLILVEIANN